MTRLNFTPRCCVAGLLLLSLLAGCGRPDPNEAIARVNSTNMQRLANLYLTYQMKNGWQGPGDEAEFKKFIENYNPEKLTRIGIDPGQVDQLFISQRDGQPFKIRYSVPGSAMGSSEPVIFEAVGMDGKKQVGFLNMEQREVEDVEYERLLSGAAEPIKTQREIPAAR